MKYSDDKLKLSGWTELGSGTWVAPDGRRFGDFEEAWEYHCRMKGKFGLRAEPDLPPDTEV